MKIMFCICRCVSVFLIVVGVSKTEGQLVLSQQGSATASGPSTELQSSFDGAVVAFLSEASDLLPGARSARLNLVRKSFSLGQTELIEFGADGRLDGYSMSADGGAFAICLRRPLAADATSPATADVYLWTDTDGHKKISVSEMEGETADGDSWDPWITPDGRFVFFKTRANNLMRDHFFGDYGYGVVRYNVETETMDAGIPVFVAGNVAPKALCSPDGNFVYTIQSLPSTWEGESPYEGQETSNFLNVFQIDEQLLIVPDLSSVVTGDGNPLVANPSADIRLDTSGFWVSVSSWGGRSYAGAFGFNVHSMEVVVSDGAAMPPISRGDYFIWALYLSPSGLWNHERGVIESPFGEQLELDHSIHGASAASSPDNKWLALIGGTRSGREHGRMMLWNLDSDELIEFGPELAVDDSVGFGAPNFLFSGDSKFLFFETSSPHFVENDNNHAVDLFRYSIETGEILLISSRNPDLPLPIRNGLTVSKAATENAVTRIFHKYSLDEESPWIEARTTETENGQVQFEDTGASLHRKQFYKAEVEPLEAGQ